MEDKFPHQSLSIYGLKKKMHLMLSNKKDLRMDWYLITLNIQKIF